MKNFKLSIGSDLFFIYLGVFSIIYALLIKNGVKFLLCLLLSSVLAVIISAIILFIMVKINEKKELNGFSSLEKQNLITFLTLLPRAKLLDFFITAYKNDELLLEIFNDGLIIKSKNVFLYPIFNASETTKQDIVDAYRKKEDYTLTIISGSYEQTAIEYAQNLPNVTLCDASDLYATLKRLNSLPKYEEIKINKFTRFVGIVKGLFNKKHAKFFFIAGVITLFSSTLTFFKTYYVITGIALLITSAICKFFAPQTKKTVGINLK